MILIEFIGIGVAHQVTEESVRHYSRLVRQYIDQVCVLFPGTTITPTQHLATHFGPILLDFGPSRDWAGWVFERLNLFAQSEETNGKSGE